MNNEFVKEEIFEEEVMEPKKSLIDKAKDLGGKALIKAKETGTWIKKNPIEAAQVGMCGVGAICMAAIAGASVSQSNAKKKDYSRLVDESIEQLKESGNQDNEIKIRLYSNDNN